MTLTLAGQWETNNAVAASLSEIVRRHTALRTRFDAAFFGISPREAAFIDQPLDQFDAAFFGGVLAAVLISLGVLAWLMISILVAGLPDLHLDFAAANELSDVGNPLGSLMRRGVRTKAASAARNGRPASGTGR